MPKFYPKFSYLFKVGSFGDSSHDYTGLPSEGVSFLLRSFSCYYYYLSDQGILHEYVVVYKKSYTHSQ